MKLSASNPSGTRRFRARTCVSRERLETTLSSAVGDVWTPKTCDAVVGFNWSVVPILPRGTAPHAVGGQEGSTGECRRVFPHHLGRAGCACSPCVPRETPRPGLKMGAPTIRLIMQRRGFSDIGLNDTPFVGYHNALDMAQLLTDEAGLLSRLKGETVWMVEADGRSPETFWLGSAFRTDQASRYKGPNSTPLRQIPAMNVDRCSN
jgi:hypothetical protein